jgi:hypothetical protein
MAERDYAHVAARFDFSGIFVEIGLAGADDHLAVADRRSLLAPRNADRTLDLNIPLQGDNRRVLHLAFDTARLDGHRANAVQCGDVQVFYCWTGFPGQARGGIRRSCKP